MGWFCVRVSAAWATKNQRERRDDTRQKELNSMKTKKTNSNTGPLVPHTLVTRVVTLWKADNASAFELGKALLEVKALNPHGGLKRFIEKCLGKGPSVRNRCSYCIRVAQGKTRHPYKLKSAGPTGNERTKFMKSAHDGLAHLYDYAQAGDFDAAELTAKGIIKQVEQLLEAARVKMGKLTKAATA
jgi:hypothetical protein